MEKYKVKVNDKEYVIEFESDSNINNIKEVWLNGEKKVIDIDMDHLSSIVVDNNTHKINGIYDYDGEPVKFLIGKDYHNVEVEDFVSIQKLNSNKSTSKNTGIITAPMPGKVVSIDVTVGDKIQKGQNLLILEAMKMENQIKSPIEGTLKNINISVGSTCNARDLLMTIE